MNLKYPQNFKESIILSVPNCTIMVLGMMSLNLWIYGQLNWTNFLHAFFPIYITAFSLDFFIVGPLVRKVVNKYHIQKYTPFIRVGLMAGVLTFLAPLIETGYLPDLSRYITAFPRNYIAAFVLQVFIAMRFGMFVLNKYRTNCAN